MDLNLLLNQFYNCLLKVEELYKYTCSVSKKRRQTSVIFSPVFLPLHLEIQRAVGSAEGYHTVKFLLRCFTMAYCLPKDGIMIIFWI